MEPLMDRTGADTTGAVTQHSPLSRRTFLRVVGTASGAALASGLLGSCGSGPTASGERVVNLLWSDVTNVRTPLIEDFTNATGIKVNQTIVQYNQRLNKIHTAVQGGGDFDVVQMDTVWTARFAAAGWVDDLTSRVTDAIKRVTKSPRIPPVPEMLVACPSGRGRPPPVCPDSRGLAADRSACRSRSRTGCGP